MMKHTMISIPFRSNIFQEDRLFVVVGFTRVYGGYYNESPESVPPKMIRPLIEKAIQLGWKYKEPGNAISLLNGTLEKDSKTAKWSAGNFIVPE